MGGYSELLLVFFLEVCQRLPALKVMLMGMLIANCPLKQKESIPVSLATTTTKKNLKSQPIC